MIDLYEDLEQTKNKNSHLTDYNIQQLSNFLNYAEKIHRFTEDGYFTLGLDTVTDILKYQGPFKSLKGVDYFSTMQQAINRYINKPELQKRMV